MSYETISCASNAVSSSLYLAFASAGLIPSSYYCLLRRALLCNPGVKLVERLPFVDEFIEAPEMIKRCLFELALFRVAGT